MMNGYFAQDTQALDGQMPNLTHIVRKFFRILDKVS